ncbi:hypothetical protein [Pseudoalteromonas sp. P1-8]|uniref:hypothetical protein n=1 Tax=Pseudoalteromonas sp. P1-8 TaxID=1710353 RepID=UPI0006DCD92A|nr:hypothetical protein [Pseudoalteromonas sp. P1-8]KPW00699.1 hypothetical protein AN213_02379 [Pseudoalteromonas sp. P1-8]
MVLKNIIFILLSSAIITGCVTNKGHRSDFKKVCDYQNRNDCSDSGFTRQKTENSKYHLGFIEFDDQGFIQGRDKKNFVMNQIRNRVEQAGKSGKPVLLLTFIHGWHHNSEGDPEDRDIFRFREELLYKAADYFTDHEIIGVYLGWRGRVIKGPLDFLTFWNRKSTAHEVGQNGMTSTLLEIEDAVKGYPIRNAQNKMVTIGHSFGGAALYSALKGVLANRFTQSRPFGTTNEVDGFGDLVLLMNPAFESLQYQSLFELSQYNCLPYPETQLPKLMVLASKQDKAVGITFQIGRLPYTLLENHEEQFATRCITPYDRNDEYAVNQWRADMLAIGHHAAYSTHKLQKRTSTLTKDNKNLTSQESWLKNQRNDDGIIPITNNVELESYNKTLANNPYMSVFVVDNLIPGHNEIWGNEIVEFVRELIQITNSESK